MSQKKQIKVKFLAKEPKNLLAEVALSDSELSRGLMYRKTMPANQGMVFLFKRSDPKEFWMKNTLLPLDIIFVDKARKILNIEHGNPLEETEKVRSRGDAKYVIETNAGFCQQNRILPGCQVRFLKTL